MIQVLRADARALPLRRRPKYRVRMWCPDCSECHHGRPWYIGEDDAMATERRAKLFASWDEAEEAVCTFRPGEGARWQHEVEGAGGRKEARREGDHILQV